MLESIQFPVRDKKRTTSKLSWTGFTGGNLLFVSRASLHLIPTLISFALLAGSLQADALSDIVGPVAVGPWSWYTVAAAGNAMDIGTAALSYKPVPGAAAAGTFTLANDCNITLTGSGASEFSVGDVAIVGWNAPNGAGTGHLAFYVGSSQGNVLTSANQCSLNGVIPASSGLTGLTVYHCTAQCIASVPNQTPSGGPYYGCGYWGVCSLGAGGWNFYDVALAIYRQYLVSCQTTCNQTYLTNFRDMADTWWLWALDQGGKFGTPPHSLSLLSQYVRALDGHPERFAPLYTFVKTYFATGFAEIDGNDNREAGLMLAFAAVGAKADTDPTRRAWYCSTVTNYADYWVSAQYADGSWPEKNSFYPYAVGGMSPWRAAFPLQGLARSYDVLNDPAVCNNASLAANVLNAITIGTNFVYTSGYAAGNRAIYYDVNYPNDGEDPVSVGLKPGTVSVSLGSTAVTGSGTSFLSTFACNGTDYIGFNHTDGYGWTHLVASCADNTHLTLATPWGSQILTGFGARGQTLTYARTDANGDGYYQSAAEATNCDSAAKTCYSQASPPAIVGGKVEGDRDNNSNLIWIHGWLYKTTGLTIYRTRGDELFSSTYGGPALGPGDSFPWSPGPCAGPACDGTETIYDLAIHSCAAGPSTPPCNETENLPGGNVWGLWLGQGPAKWYGQGSGIGGADNYLAWRLGSAKQTTITGITSTISNHTYGAGTNIPIQVTFSSPVTVTGTPRLTLNSGAWVNYVSGSGTNILTFTYTVGSGQTTSGGKLEAASVAALTLSSATIADSNNLAAVLTLPAAGSAGSLSANTSIVIDAAAPTVISYSVVFGSASETYNLTTNTRYRLPWQITGIQVVFSKAIGTADAGSISGVSLGAPAGLGTNTLTWNLSSALSNGSFTTSIPGTGSHAILDTLGNPLTAFNTNFKVLWGDFTDDGIVNSQDLVLVNAQRSRAYYAPADLNGDGAVDTADVIVARNRQGAAQQ